MMMTNSIWKIYMQILNEKESKNLLNKRKKKMKNIVLWLSIRNHQRLLISHPKTQVRYKLLDRGQKVIQTATGAKASFHSYTSNSASHTDSCHLDSTLLIVRSILDPRENSSIHCTMTEQDHENLSHSNRRWTSICSFSNSILQYIKQLLRIYIVNGQIDLFFYFDTRFSK